MSYESKANRRQFLKILGFSTLSGLGSIPDSAIRNPQSAIGKAVGNGGGYEEI